MFFTLPQRLACVFYFTSATYLCVLLYLSDLLMSFTLPQRLTMCFALPQRLLSCVLGLDLFSFGVITHIVKIL